MNRALWAVAALYLSLPLAAQRNARGPLVPAELQNSSARAAWVAADVALDAGGRVREDKLQSYAAFVASIAAIEAREAQNAAAGAAQPCAAMVEANAESTASRSPEELVARTATAVRGRIAAMRQGFYHGRPGSLLRLEAVVYLRGRAADETYLFYPSAAIVTSEGKACSAPGKRYGAPRVGDEVIVLDPAPSPLRFRNSSVLWVDVPEHLVYLPAGGEPILPSPLLSLQTAPDPVGAIAELLGRDAR